MSQEELKADLTRKALEICKDRLATDRLFVSQPIMQSIQWQLEWLIEFYQGRSTERAKLRQLTFGHIAAREIEPSDHELATSLHRAYYAASRTAAGLKLDMEVLGLDV